MSSSLDPWYLTGLLDGGGSFTFSRSGQNVNLYFAVRRPRADVPLLEAVRASLGGVGTVYTPGRGALWRVTRVAELGRILDHFDAFPLRSRKAAAYAVWREMVLLKQAFRQPDRERLNGLAAALTRANSEAG